MTERINFKLAHNGVTHKFASTFRDGQLFDAVRQKVATVVCDDNFELFWKDDESSIVLDTVADLATAIDFARAMRVKSTDTPCVHLSVAIDSPAEEEKKQWSEAAVDNENKEATAVAAAEKAVQEEKQASAVKSANIEAPAPEAKQQEETTHDESPSVSDQASVDSTTESATPPADVLSEVQKRLRQLFDSALIDKWLTDLRTAMAPLYNPLNNELQHPSETCAAEIAACLGNLEKRIPEELKSLLEKLSNKQLREFVHGDWLESDARERFPLSAQLNHSSHLEAASAVKLVLDMTVSPIEMDADDYSEYEDEDDEEDDESEVEPEEEKVPEEENPSTHPEWIRQRSSAIVALARKNMASVQSKATVYRCPLQALHQLKLKRNAAPRAPKPDEPTETPSASIPVDRLERFKELLRKNTELSVDPAWEETVQDTVSISSIDIYQRTKRREALSQDNIETRIADLLARTVEGIPKDLQQEFEALSPEELGRMVILDWTDRMIEEKRAVRNLQSRALPNEMATYCSLDTLHNLMYIGMAVQMYPEVIRKVAKHIMKKHDDAMKKKHAEEERKMSDAELKHRREDNAYSALEVELNKYMNCFKMLAFMNRFVPLPRRVPRDYTVDYPKWKEIFSSLNMIQEMHQYTNQPYLPEVENEIAAMLYRCVRNNSERTLKSFENDPGFLGHWPACECLWRLEKKQRAFKRNLKNVPCGNDQESNPYKMAPSFLAALLFMNAAETSIPEDFIELLPKLEMQKSSDLYRSEEAQAFQDLRASSKLNPQADPNPPAKTNLYVLIAWVDQQAALILRAGQARLAPVFAPIRQSALVALRPPMMASCFFFPGANQTVQHTQPMGPHTILPTAAPAPPAKENQTADMASELNDMKARIEELERFIKGKLAMFQTKMFAFEQKFENNNCEKENKEFDGFKEKLVEMEKRLKIVEEEIESDLAEIMPVIHFKLAYRGNTYRFAPTVSEQQLFNEVHDRVAKIVQEEAFKLYWNDGDSNVLLRTVDDLVTAVDFAISGATPGKPPCVQLKVKLAADKESEAAAAVDVQQTSAHAAPKTATMAPAVEALLEFHKQQGAKSEQLLGTSESNRTAIISSLRIHQDPATSDIRLQIHFDYASEYSLWEGCVTDVFKHLNLSERKLATDVAANSADAQVASADATAAAAARNSAVAGQMAAFQLMLTGEGCAQAHAQLVALLTSHASTLLPNVTTQQKEMMNRLDQVGTAQLLAAYALQQRIGQQMTKEHQQMLAAAVMQQQQQQTKMQQPQAAATAAASNSDLPEYRVTVDKHSRKLLLTVPSEALDQLLMFLHPLAIETKFLHVQVTGGVKILKNVAQFLEGANVEQLTLTQEEDNKEQYEHWRLLTRRVKPSKLRVNRINLASDLLVFLIQVSYMVDSIWIGSLKCNEGFPVTFIKLLLGKKCSHVHISDTATNIPFEFIQELGQFLLHSRKLATVIVPSTEKIVVPMRGDYGHTSISARNHEKEKNRVVIEHVLRQ